ncbi:DafA protein [Desulfovibrio sp. DV]|uniref:chaperone modulator CbpM n=1 Tax=Desulfovibrio sp. DV TaxID=1844708 RepID=UPI00094B8636|nr:chaperone modulator CbpM [Desulfovibrio sp. DV]OLN30568.1 DafA protein [Desulfovibrio sp. DV]
MEIKHIVIAGSLPARSERLSLAQVQELTGLDSAVVGELIELGWITPERTTSEAFLFRSRDVYRLRKLDRIKRDFELPLLGASIVVDLLERIEYLEGKVNELHRLL